MRKIPKRQKNSGSSFTVAMHPTNSTPYIIAVKIVTYWLYLTLDFIIRHKFSAKLRIIRELSKKYLAIVYPEDTEVADFFASKALKRLCDIRRRRAVNTGTMDNAIPWKSRVRGPDIR